LRVPALRERAEDIPDLADAIVRRLARRLGVEAPTLTPAALEVLQKFNYPGNVRELENVLERAMALCNQGRIDVQDLQLRSVPRPEPSTAAKLETASPVSAAVETAAASSASTPHALGAQLEDVERAAIIKALEEARYNKTAAARALGMTFRALRYRIKKLDIK
jgi:two-component system response regulator PilR (NtrC family)